MLFCCFCVVLWGAEVTFALQSASVAARLKLYVCYVISILFVFIINILNKKLLFTSTSNWNLFIATCSKRSWDGEINSETSCVLFFRYNTLLAVVSQSLCDVMKALKGSAVMSPELERTVHSLFNCRVPDVWTAKARLTLIHVFTVGVKLRDMHYMWFCECSVFKSDFASLFSHIFCNNVVCIVLPSIYW